MNWTKEVAGRFPFAAVRKLKQCNRCQRPKPVTAFRRNSRKRGARRPECAACADELMRQKCEEAGLSHEIVADPGGGIMPRPFTFGQVLDGLARIEDFFVQTSRDESWHGRKSSAATLRERRLEARAARVALEKLGEKLGERIDGGNSACEGLPVLEKQVGQPTHP